MTTTWNFYCDESGNTGANYWDRDQPYCIEGGWIVRPEQEEGLARVVQGALRRRQEQINASCPKGQKAKRVVELKGADLVKSREGQAVALDVVLGLLRLGCVPLFILAERRFCAAGKAVDVFLDDHTNPAAASLPLWGNTNRLRLGVTHTPVMGVAGG